MKIRISTKNTCVHTQPPHGGEEISSELGWTYLSQNCTQGLCHKITKNFGYSPVFIAIRKGEDISQIFVKSTSNYIRVL